MKEQTKMMAPSDYFTYQNRDNSLSIKFRDYKEEVVHESEKWSRYANANH